MTCDELEQFFHPYLDGEFDPEARQEMDAHLAGCGTCASRLHEEAQFVASVRAASAAVRQPAPEALKARLRGDFARERRRELQTSWLRLGAAAAVAVAVGGGVWQLRGASAKKRYLEAAVSRHAKGHPMEISQQPRENVEAWFGGKLDHHVRVPQLSNVQLAGARLSNVSEKPAAYIRYELPSRTGLAPRPVGLFIFDDAEREVRAEPLPQLSVTTSNGYNVATWRDGEIVYELISDLDEADIRQMLTTPHIPADVPHRSKSVEVQPASFEQ
ncbi:MAG: anti-sigma factor family protein [Myxococcaceae bacterium]